MPKYRPLTSEELAPLEEDFVKFLVLNGLTSDDWIKMKEEDTTSANGIIDAFSDVVFEKILRSHMYLDYISPKAIYCIQCLADKMVLVGAEINGDQTFDVNNPDLSSIDGVRVFTTEKAYKGNRQAEMFEHLEKHYQLSDGALFKRLCMVL